mgnify:FL=1
MTKTLVSFIKVALTLAVALFFISFYYLAFNQRIGLDPDSMLLAMLLVVFTGLASVIMGVILYFLHKRN